MILSYMYNGSMIVSFMCDSSIIVSCVPYGSMNVCMPIDTNIMVEFVDSTLKKKYPIRLYM